MVHQPILVPLYTLLWTYNFLVVGLAGEGHLIGPQSPDITPMDSFFWKYIKDIMHCERPATQRHETSSNSSAIRGRSLLLYSHNEQVQHFSDVHYAVLSSRHGWLCHQNLCMSRLK
ncbi:uncharacterized protein LOC117283191 [Cryptotermes secundus]|uniref:uncharacterized protein LOC117283191 n=1 Tax=Cryptotermes secundus TaxID=105785 RepID=UPI001454CE3C|nr:uncharacterized protein LOC117283191 [Cryptotermes secundus]